MWERDLQEEFVEEREVTFSVGLLVVDVIQQAFRKPAHVIELQHRTLQLKKRRAGTSLYLFLESPISGRTERLIFAVDAGMVQVKYAPKLWLKAPRGDRKYELAEAENWGLEQAARHITTHQAVSSLVKAKRTLFYGKGGRLKARLDHMLPVGPGGPLTAAPFYDLEFESHDSSVAPAIWAANFLTTHRLPLDLPPIRRSKQERARVSELPDPPTAPAGLAAWVRARLDEAAPFVSVEAGTVARR